MLHPPDVVPFTFLYFHVRSADVCTVPPPLLMPSESSSPSQDKRPCAPLTMWFFSLILGAVQVTWGCCPGVRWRAFTGRQAASRSSCSSSTCRATSPSTANLKSMGQPALTPRLAGEELMGRIPQLLQLAACCFCRRHNRKGRVML